MPLTVGKHIRKILPQMEAALTQRLARNYKVISGRRVLNALWKASSKQNAATRNRSCDDASCMKAAAKYLQAKIFAMVYVTKIQGGYFMSIDISDVTSNKTLFENTLPCRGCSQSQVIDKLQELLDTPDAMPKRDFQTGSVFMDCSNCPKMVVVPAGNFDMGSIDSEEQDEKPEHNVPFEQPFAMSKTEVTLAQFSTFVTASGYDAVDNCWVLTDDKWEESTDNNWRHPGYRQGNNHPVACISWKDAQAYVKWLSAKTDRTYQLPSESQWEYACRAGEKFEYCGSDNVEDVAWYQKNSGYTTHPTAQKQANAFGLYDLSGNVGEWVEDSYHEHYINAPFDGSAWIEDRTKRVLRGGSWAYPPKGERAAFRSVSSPDYRYFDTGFRVVRTLPELAEKP